MQSCQRQLTHRHRARANLQGFAERHSKVTHTPLFGVWCGWHCSNALKLWILTNKLWRRASKAPLGGCSKTCSSQRKARESVGCFIAHKKKKAAAVQPGITPSICGKVQTSATAGFENSCSNCSKQCSSISAATGKNAISFHLLSAIKEIIFDSLKVRLGTARLRTEAKCLLPLHPWQVNEVCS